MTSGVLVVDKPEGPTSHDIVVMARRAFGQKRVGHCGTLDPMATGVVVLALGAATRLVQFLSAEDKHYEATIRFGLTTATYDRTGAVVSTSASRPTRPDLDTALTRFRGVIEQRPPAFSAKKVGGVPAYELARRDASVAAALRPVEVTVSRLDVVAFDGEQLRVSLHVSAGFYVRSLAHDLGAALGTGATLDALRRTRSGAFGLEDSVSVEELVSRDQGCVRARVIPLPNLLRHLPARTLDAREVALVRHGQDVLDGRPAAPPSAVGGGPVVVRLLGPDGALEALASTEHQGLLHPFVVLG
jgi:tRNA pseudouridine55 synthase